MLLFITRSAKQTEQRKIGVSVFMLIFHSALFCLYYNITRASTWSCQRPHIIIVLSHNRIPSGAIVVCRRIAFTSASFFIIKSRTVGIDIYSLET